MKINNLFLGLICVTLLLSYKNSSANEKKRGAFTWLEELRSKPKEPWGNDIVNKHTPVMFIVDKNQWFPSYYVSAKNGLPINISVQKTTSGRYEVTVKGENAKKDDHIRIPKCFVPNFHLDCELDSQTMLTGQATVGKNKIGYYREYQATMHIEADGFHYSIWDDVPFKPAEEWDMPSGYKFEFKFWLDEALPQLWANCTSKICSYSKGRIDGINKKIFHSPPKGLKTVSLFFDFKGFGTGEYVFDFTK